MTKARDIANAGTALSSVDATELGYLDGVTSSIQTQLNNISGSKAQPTEPSSPTDGMIWVDTDGSTTDANFIPKTLTSTTGDIIYASSANTPARLGIGSTSQVLTVSGGVPSWATPAASGMTLIKRASFSAVANTGTTFDDVFTSTYSSYLVIVENLWAATATDDPEFQLRYAGPTTMAVQYLGSGSKLTTGGTVSWIDNYDEVQFKLGDETGDSGFPGGGQIFFNGVGNASERATWRGQFLGGQNAVNYYFAGNQYNAQTYTGILFKSSSSNITGTISVYGMAKS